ncbi:MAG TPA: hypothetical protein PLY40_06645 [Bacillota bacterium]|nr:hypothetical protein [Bacillota bacterium]
MEETTLAAAAALGIELVELPQWQCCGAVFPLYEDEAISLLSPASPWRRLKDSPWYLFVPPASAAARIRPAACNAANAAPPARFRRPWICCLTR